MYKTIIKSVLVVGLWVATVWAQSPRPGYLVGETTSNQIGGVKIYSGTQDFTLATLVGINVASIPNLTGWAATATVSNALNWAGWPAASNALITATASNTAAVLALNSTNQVVGGRFLIQWSSNFMTASVAVVLGNYTNQLGVFPP